MINIVNLGLKDYNDALEIQLALQQKRIENKIQDTLLLLEHNHVLTMGTRGKTRNIYLSSQQLKDMGVETVYVNRGGDVTYHGPGQIVGYPIFNLSICDKDIRLFIQKLENSIISLLKDRFNIEAYTQSGRFTGIWAQDKKIAAIGISVSKWVTMHGFAFNVNTDLKCFDWINPCGLNKGVTSVCEVTGEKQDMAEMFLLTGEYIAKEFNSPINYTEISALI
jgi:lipoyl(octanoyl) transferase